MTPRELDLAVEAYNHKLQYEREQAIIQAYYTAIWARWVKKPPKIMQILEKLRPRKQVQKMSPEQWLQVLKRRHE